jgi:hypothetical protein
VSLTRGELDPLSRKIYLPQQRVISKVFSCRSNWCWAMGLGLINFTLITISARERNYFNLSCRAHIRCTFSLPCAWIIYWNRHDFPCPLNPAAHTGILFSTVLCNLRRIYSFGHVNFLWREKLWPRDRIRDCERCIWEKLLLHHLKTLPTP